MLYVYISLGVVIVGGAGFVFWWFVIRKPSVTPPPG